ncbi:MAG TPA: rhomboid family intramembrane serine protease [Solirubrobacteraceae bacterium]|nr:rhomboid family intramembrane serine protease [Solirubrobacteraceae bacterium]
MPPAGDLFVVCKQCGSQVSPYITECPYCGHRLRQRAPKLPRVKRRRGVLGRFVPRPAFARSPSAVGSPRRRRFSRQAHHPRGESRPVATIALVAAGCAGWVVVSGGYVSFTRLAIVGPPRGDWWKLLSSPFAYRNGLYAFAALLATALFGWLLERRRGPVVVAAVFLGGAVTGALAALALYEVPIVSGANAGALALLCAWAIPDLQALRRGYYYEGDLLGAGAIAAVLLVLPYARPEASWLAGVVGAILGLVVGTGLHLVDPPEL